MKWRHFLSQIQRPESVNNVPGLTPSYKNVLYVGWSATTLVDCPSQHPIFYHLIYRLSNGEQVITSLTPCPSFSLFINILTCSVHISDRGDAPASWLTAGAGGHRSACFAGWVASERENVGGASEGETFRGVLETRTASASPTEDGQEASPHRLMFILLYIMCGFGNW